MTTNGRDYRTLLGSLVLLGLIYPLLNGAWFGYGGRVAWTAVFWMVLALAIRAMRVSVISHRADVVLLVLAIGLGAVGLVNGIDHDPTSTLHMALRIGADVFSLALLLHVAASILRDVLSAGRVDINRIWGAICVYVLIALVWAYVLGLLCLLFDDCLVLSDRFQSPAIENPQLDDLATRLYFSFVTITTVGYGDIAPGNAVSRLFATAEAITGQLYLTVLVARLVGLHISQSRSETSGDS